MLDQFYLQQPLVVIDQTVCSVPEQTSWKDVERNYVPSRNGCSAALRSMLGN